MNGEILGDDTWKLHPVNKKFVEDYEDTLKYIHKPEDIYYLNKNYEQSGYDSIVDNFAKTYYTNMFPVYYNYMSMKKVDVATQPQYITPDNYDQFVENNPTEKDNNLKRKFFLSDGEFYRIDYFKEEYDEDGIASTVAVPRGFYYVKTKEDLKWCADKINGAIYNNQINIVLGDNIGNDDITELNFNLGTYSEQPFEGILYGNGFCFKNINLICSENTNGIVGYLGTSGIISTMRIDGDNNRMTCDKKISITHLQNAGTDIYAGFICGKNNGYINKIDINGSINVVDFIPAIYSVDNKTDDSSNTHIFNNNTDKNIFYPDYLCYNSLGNIIPYIGYFNEGVFATLSGYDKNTKETKSYWKTDSMVSGFMIKSYEGLNSPEEWYYWDGVFVPNLGYIESFNSSGNRKNVLYYDTSIFAITNNSTNEAAGYSPAASYAGVLPINFYINAISAPYDGNYRMMDMRKKREISKQYEFFENAQYFDKSIKMQQQNRAAYYVSPIAGLNASIINDFSINTNIITSGTFVGFIGGVAGKQLNGTISAGAINVSSKDAVLYSVDDLKALSSTMSYSSFTGNSATYHCRNYYYSKAANTTDNDASFKYCFPMQSIKNIGGLFGECVVAGGKSALVIDKVSAFLENQNAKVIQGGNGRHGVPEDYYLFDKFATLTPIIEYDNANISDIYTTFDELNNKISRTIWVKDSTFTYNESLSKEDEANNSALKAIIIKNPDDQTPYVFKQVFNIHGNPNAAYFYPYDSKTEQDIDNDAENVYLCADGAASPLVCEIKPTFQITPSIIQTLFANMPYINSSGFLEDYAHYAPNYVTMGYEDFEAYPISGMFAKNGSAYEFNTMSSQNNYIGLYGMDQNLASPVSNPEFYSIDLATTLPGVKNAQADNTDIYSGTLYDRFVRPQNINVSLNIKDLMKNIIYWNNCKVTNNHNVWYHPNDRAAGWSNPNIFKYTVVPRAAQLPQIFNDQADRSISSINQMQDDDYISNAGYNSNKIPYTYAYFGSDVKLATYNLQYNQTVTNLSGYKLTLLNPNYKAPLNNDVGTVQYDLLSGYEVTVNLSANSNRYTVVAVTGNDTNSLSRVTVDSDHIGRDGSITYSLITLGGENLTSRHSAYYAFDYLGHIEPTWLGAYMTAVSGFNFEFTGSENVDWTTNDINMYVHYSLLYDFVNDPNMSKPLQDRVWTHAVVFERKREDGSNKEIKYAYNVPLTLEKVEPIYKRKPVATTSYVTGYLVDSNGTITDVYTATTPPQLYSAYIMEHNYTSAQKSMSIAMNYSAVPANANNNEINYWQDAPLTTVVQSTSVKIPVTRSFSILSRLGDSFNPKQIIYKTNDPEYNGSDKTTSAIWSAAICEITQISENGTATTRSAFLANDANSYIESADALLQTIDMDPNKIIFQYGNTFNYLTINYEYEEPVMRTPWWQQTVQGLRYGQLGEYSMDYIGSNNDASLYTTELIKVEARQEPYAKNTNNWFPQNNLRASKEGNDDSELHDYFKYTYIKYNGNNNIGRDGINLDVHFDASNNKAGFWFTSNESADSAYNDDVHYASNVFCIGKTPNQSCIINEHLSVSGVSAVTFSSFSADDFEGLYITDSQNMPVMYIDVGMGECQEGTTWSYSSYPASAITIKKYKQPGTDVTGYIINDDTSNIYNDTEIGEIRANLSGLFLEVET